MGETQRRIATFAIALLTLLSGMSALPVNAQAREYVSIDDGGEIKLYYEEAGSGDPLVFVPGWTMTVRYFDRQLDYFEGSKSTRFIVYDPRAHGRSTRTLDGANYVQHARDLKAFIDRLGLKQVVLGGWSWGMDTVYAYISMYGTDNIRAVVNIDQAPNPLASGEGAWTDGDTTGAKAFFDAFAADRTAATRAFLPTMFTKPPSPEDLRWMESEAMQTPDIVAQLLYYDGWMFDHTETVRKIDVPQLYYVSQGKAAAASAFILRNSPQAELVALGEHAMFYDHAAEFNDRLAKFLAKHPKTAPASNR